MGSKRALAYGNWVGVIGANKTIFRRCYRHDGANYSFKVVVAPAGTISGYARDLGSLMEVAVKDSGFGPKPFCLFRSWN